MKTMSQLKVTDLTIEEFQELVRETVLQTLLEILSDPDSGLELQEYLKEELRSSIKYVETGGEMMPVHEVAEKLGLTW